MAERIEYLHFDALNTPLQGVSLIEASAGTGKTYSIAILALRLVLEHSIPVTDILMVTFTKAAVAELEERIRHFIRIAYKGSLGADVQDPNIKTLLYRASEKTGPEAVARHLRHAVLLLDELSVKTIHSFCQATLDEFAFETAQPFGATTLSDTAAILDEELARFWRSHITTLQAPLLALLWADGMMENLKAAIREHLSGKQYHGYDAAADYSISEHLQQQWLDEYERMHAAAEEPWQALIAEVAQRQSELHEQCMSNANARKKLPELLADPEAFLLEIESKKTTAYVQKLFGDLLEGIDRCRAAGQERAMHLGNMHNHIKCLAIRIVSSGISRLKQQRNVITYDDMLNNLHGAVSARMKDRLAAGLRKRYKAVFIDEFQDTDRQQYEIFQTVFGQETVVCYIGDPKQSIYGWRKADMSTYFKARSEADRCYSMNHNYRSSASLIAAMNRFFQPEEGFDTFRYGQKINAISYIPVQSPDNNTKGELYNRAKPEVPISVFNCKRKQEITDGTAAQIACLLVGDEYRIVTPGGERGIVPSDIGVLVRSASEGRSIRSALEYAGIPAVMMDDAKVLQSEESGMLLHLLQAMASPARATISRALLCPITQITTDDLLRLHDEAIVQRFTTYRSRWVNDGVYAAIMDFMAEFAVSQTLLTADRTGSGERTLTNFYQIAELVHQAQNRKGLSTVELISWLQRSIEGAVTEGDEYEQRVESDEEAVSIITIHKSKGLEYNIVFAPHMDLVCKDDYAMLSFRDDDTGHYLSVESQRMTDQMRQWYTEQQEQENARLLYVAITRAVYKCYLFHSAFYKISTLTHFLAALGTADPELICFESGQPAIPAVRYKRASANRQGKAVTAHFKLQQPYWSKLSYTRLAARAEHSKRPVSTQPIDDYERFIFSELYRGNKTGDLLHAIFERISYTDNSRWDEIIEEVIGRHAPAQISKYKDGLRRMVEEVLHAVLPVGEESVTLSEVDWRMRIAEFEFDFPVDLFTVESLQQLSDSEASYRIRQEDGRTDSELEGFMNGKIDLFFYQQGKYYILDWKSNYLGDSLDCYRLEILKEAMTEANYHLQYLIYCVAVKKYLQSRMPDFDYDRDFGGVIYLFVRGVRRNSNEGIFTCKPSLKKISMLERLFDRKIERGPAESGRLLQDETISPLSNQYTQSTLF